MKRIKRWLEWWLKRDIQMAILRELHEIRMEMQRQGKQAWTMQPLASKTVGAWTPYEPLKPLQPLGTHK